MKTLDLDSTKGTDTRKAELEPVIIVIKDKDGSKLTLALPKKLADMI